MAEPLKDFFSPAVARRLGAAVAAVAEGFSAAQFEADALAADADLSLTARARQWTRALRRQLPDDYRAAIEILLASMGPRGVEAAAAASPTPTSAMAPFYYLPHVYYVADYGLDDFETSMHAQYVLTQVFTAEFSIRFFLDRHPEATLARLHQWARDPSEHVRRLVSEGTRPLLPWAHRLRAFQRDPTPVLALLELLKDDPSLYVRRSVANNLNDIGKDHPGLLAATCRRWLEDAGPERRWLVQHALRSAVKRGDPAALAVLGADARASCEVVRAEGQNARPRIGESWRWQGELRHIGATPEKWVVDLAVHFVKANGRSAAKVFKLKVATLAPGESLSVAKTITLADLTTRRHYPGRHEVELLINGQALKVGAFELLAAEETP